MDDIVILSASKEYLHNLLKNIRSYLKENLDLEIKSNYQIFPVDDRGIDFVGYRHFHGYKLLRKTTLKDCKKIIEAIQGLYLEKTCCKRAFIRGAFMASGSMSDPEKTYHFEIITTTEPKAVQLRDMIRFFNVDAKIVKRKKYFVVYVKDGSQIVDILNIMEAHKALMDLENVRILKEMRNSINRQVNCEAANINKTVTAATKQLDDILYIKETVGFGDLTPGLEEIASLRIEHPDASLKELGSMLSTPIGKSGVNHRLRKLSNIADSLREQKEEK